MNFDFTVEDIENYLRIAKAAEESDEYQSMKKLLEVRKKISIFNRITKEELEALVYDVRFKRYKYEEFIVKQNERSQEVFHILKGEVHAFIDGAYIGSLQAGETFGEIGVITETPRSADIQCVSNECLLLSFKIDQENLEFNAPALAILYKNLAKSINEKLQRLNISVATKQP